jgi:hypothetical protein
MSEIQRTILTITEPTIKLDKFAIPDLESQESDGPAANSKVSKMLGSIFPAIDINGLKLPYENIVDFELTSGGFLPTISLRFYDKAGLFTSKHLPQDGMPVKVYLKSSGDEKTFKPIRIDFTTDNIISSAVDPVRGVLYSVTGKMRIPNLYTEFQESYSESSFNTLLEISEKLQLGFASNLDGTDDSMVWVNPYDTREKFIRDITANAYKSDSSFIDTFIDPYYYLTMVDMNPLFDIDDQLETSVAYPSGFTNIQQASPDDPGTPLGRFISNHLSLNGTDRFIVKFSMMNNTGYFSDKNGYKRYSQHYEIQDKEFISEYIDPLTTEGTDHMIHMKGRYVGPVENRVPEGIAQKQNKYKYLGRFNRDTVHQNYAYSNILNIQNLEEVQKMGMTVELNQVNTTLARGQRLAVQIYDADYRQKQAQKSTQSATEELDTPTSANVAKQDAVNTTVGDDPNTMIFNQYLSGFYVIDQVIYVFRAPGPMTMRLRLVRREFNPPA